MSKSNDLGQGSVGKLLLKLALPAITAQIVNLLYNVVDRMYIGHIPEIGAQALTGVGVAFPIIMIIAAFSSLVGMGGAPRAAIKMGEKDNKGAEKILGNCFILLIAISIALTVLFFIYGKDLLMMFGASEKTVGYALDYLNIYLIGTIFVQISLGLNMFITTQGFAAISMFTVVIGAVINIVLDPILIFGFNMGVKGAALATIISQCVSAIWVLAFLFGKKTILKIKPKYMRLHKSIVFSVLALGISPFIMQSTESLVSIALNSSLQRFGGDVYVGAMTILTSIMQFVMLPLMGLTQGAQPIISYNFGARKNDRVKRAFNLTLISSLAYTIIFWAAIMIVPKVFVLIFNNTNQELIKTTVWALRIYFASIFIFGAQCACQQAFIAVGQAKSSLFLALLRKIILLIPLVFILPLFFADNSGKVFAVFLAEPIADIISVTVTIIMFACQFKKILKYGSADSAHDTENPDNKNPSVIDETEMIQE